MKTKISIVHYTKSKKVSIQIGDDPSCSIYDLETDSQSLCLELMRFHDFNVDISVQKKEFYN
jgi:hypothetical protein